MEVGTREAVFFREMKLGTREAEFFREMEVGTREAIFFREMELGTTEAEFFREMKKLRKKKPSQVNKLVVQVNDQPFCNGKKKKLGRLKGGEERK